MLIEHIGFGEYDFGDIIIRNIPNSYDGHQFEVQKYPLTTHGQGLSNWSIKGKTLTIEGWILADNQLEFEKRVDRIKSQLLRGKQKLTIKRSYGLVSTEAVVAQLSIPRSQRTINATEIRIVFEIMDPFWYGVETTEVGFGDVVSDFETTLSYREGAFATKPTISIAFHQAEGVDRIRYTLAGKTVTITTTIKQGDFLMINGDKLSIAQNGVRGVDWIGEFGELNIGEQPLKLEINGNYRAEVFIAYKNCYV